MGVFLAYIGQYAYVVDCFATSTPWEYELFKTDDAMRPDEPEEGMLRVIPSDELEGFWPNAPDTALAGWLAAADSGAEDREQT